MREAQVLSGRSGPSELELQSEAFGDFHISGPSHLVSGRSFSASVTVWRLGLDAIPNGPNQVYIRRLAAVVAERRTHLQSNN